MNHAHSEDFLRMADEARKQITEVSPAEARKLVPEEAKLLDVREADEFDECSLPKATHLSRGLLEMRVHEVAPDKTMPVICYCSGGNRGALAAATLKHMGYTAAFSIRGGMKASLAETSQSAPSLANLGPVAGFHPSSAECGANCIRVTSTQNEIPS